MVLRISNSNSKLRDELKSVTTEGFTNAEIESVNKERVDFCEKKRAIDEIQLKCIRKVYQKHKRDFSCRSADQEGGNNCHAYALRAANSEESLKRLANLGEDRGFIDGSGMRKLIVKGILLKTDPAVGCIVMYFDNKNLGAPKHSGIIKELRNDGNHLVESKWGEIPFVITHRIDEVPSSYGDYVEFLKAGC